MIEPYVPVTAEPTLVDAEPTTPAATPLTAFVSPESGSVSLVSTLPVGFVPAVPSATPPASTAVAVSVTATGASLAPWIVTVICVVEVAPAVSHTVYVNTSVNVLPEVRKAWTVALLLSTV